MKRYFLIALSAMILASSGAAFAANDSNNDVYNAMDANNNGQVTQKEFNGYYFDNNVFTYWDLNDDGYIGPKEFHKRLFNYYDANDDGLISDAEMQTAPRWTASTKPAKDF